MPSVFTPYQTRSLFITLGTNPLPAYVAATLLSRPDTQVYLITTADVGYLADQLIAQLKKNDEAAGIFNRKLDKIEVDPGDAVRIKQTVRRHAETARRQGTIGLNYTGGTRPMSLFSYQAVTEVDPLAVCSYLDPRKLGLRFTIGENASFVSTRGAVQLDLQQLLSLHAYEYRIEANRVLEPVRKPVQADLARRMAEVYYRKCQAAGLKEFKDWIPKWRNWINASLDVPELADFAFLWAGKNTLADVVAEWQRLGEIPPGENKNPLRYLLRWLEGLWLENYTAECVRRLAPEFGLNDWGMNFKPSLAQALLNRRNAPRFFEIDVAAMKGYRLYLLSCGSGFQKGKLKLKFIEALTRARQIGGEEARAALISGSLPYHPDWNPDSSPEQIEVELCELWDKHTQVRVFGLEHLPELERHLREWFEEK